MAKADDFIKNAAAKIVKKMMPLFYAFNSTSTADDFAYLKKNMANRLAIDSSSFCKFGGRDTARAMMKDIAYMIFYFEMEKELRKMPAGSTVGDVRFSWIASNGLR